MESLLKDREDEGEDTLDATQQRNHQSLWGESGAGKVESRGLSACETLSSKCKKATPSAMSTTSVRPSSASRNMIYRLRSSSSSGR
jgi:hypothetical protein